MDNTTLKQQIDTAITNKTAFGIPYGYWTVEIINNI